MKKDEVRKLAELARIRLTDEELTSFSEDFGEILGYVEQVRDIAADAGELGTSAAVNVFREDVPSHEPGEYTEALLSLAPKRSGQYIQVKKIIDNA